MRLKLLVAASALAMLAACGKTEPAKPVADAKPAAPTTPALGTFGVDLAAMDKNVKPGDDFYKYVNGGWIATAKMPADKARYGSFDALRDKSDADVKSLLEEMTKAPPTDPTQKKIADLYAAWMDEATIEQRGIEPLKPYLDKIAAVKTKADLMKLVGDIDMTSPIGWGIQPDPADTTKYAVFVGQSGLGMGRDYYTNTGEKYDNYRKAYQAYIETILKLAGDADAAKSAKAVFDLEMKLAKVQWTPAQQRDVKATYNPMNRDGLNKLAPNVDWGVVLETAGLKDTQNVVVAETSAITKGAALLNSQPIDTWKKYMTFHIASDAASTLPKAFDEAQFGFYSKTMRGIEAQRDRWKRGVGLVDGNMGEGLGQAYVAKYFPPGNKAKMDELVKNLLAALKTRIEKLDWMDEPTRQEALKKLATFDPRIGYPVKWRDYTALTVEPGKLFESVQNSRKFEWNRQVGRLGGKVDREEWVMTPPTVNAYYDPLMNQITFPAAILQPPFFDPNADLAVNYGAIGAVIGHEIGHGFDDQGSEFDEKGKIRNWWSKDTAAKFKARTTALGAQYHQYCPIPGDAKTCVNGDLTMGENIGDLGGIQMAYTAYHMALGGKEAPVIDGFTGDQRFFLAFGQIWRAIARDDAVRNQILTNPHSPDSVRGTNPERNVDAWYDAFGVKEGDKMFLAPDKRIKIW